MDIKRNLITNLSSILILGAIVAGVFLIEKIEIGTSIERSAKAVLEACSESSYHPTCYDQEIPKLLNELSLEETFDVVRIVQSKDTSYGYCHVLGHELGEQEVAKDPSKWMDIATSCPADGICANGCLHGALIERFAGGEWGLTETQIDNAVSGLYNACEKREGYDPSELDRAICYHGQGHLTMFMTNADIPRSLDICDRISIRENGQDFRDVCYEGTFMQLFQPLEPEDFVLIENIEVTKANFSSFCNGLSDLRRQTACYISGWPVFREEIATPQGLMDYCLLPESEFTQNRCFQMLFHTTSQGANFAVDTLNEFCNGIPLSHRGMCFGNVAMAMVQADPRFVDQALGLCGGVGDEKSKNECFSNLSEYARYRFHTESDDFSALCGGLPQRWQRSCSVARSF